MNNPYKMYRTTDEVGTVLPDPNPPTPMLPDNDIGTVLPDPNPPTPTLPGVVLPVPMPPICTDSNYIPNRRYCKVRFLHAIPGAEPVTVMIGTIPVVSGLAFSESTDYVGVTGSFWTVSIYSDTTPTTLLYKQTISFDAGETVTMAIVLSGDTVDLLPVYETGCKQGSTNISAIRFVNLAAMIGALDIYTQNDRLVACDVTYKNITPYKLARPGNYTFRVVETETLSRDFDVAEMLSGEAVPFPETESPIIPLLTFDVEVKTRENCTVYLLGGLDQDTPLQGLILD